MTLVARDRAQFAFRHATVVFLRLDGSNGWWAMPGCATVMVVPASGHPRFDPAHGITLSPRSLHVTGDGPYPVNLYLSCGPQPRVDFDGSFWDVQDRYAYTRLAPEAVMAKARADPDVRDP